MAESNPRPTAERKRGCGLHGCWKVIALGVLLVVGCRLLPYKVRGAGPLSMFDVPWNELAFDSDAWKSKEPYGMSHFDQPGSDMKRGLMLWDLFDEHICIGMTMDRARELLGEPDSPGNSGRRWRYELGMWSGLRFEMDFLVLRFDEDGKLFEFFWYQG